MKIGAFQNRTGARLQYPNPLLEYVHYFPAPKMLDHMNGQNLVRRIIRELIKIAHITNDIGLLASSFVGNINIDIARKYLVAAAKI